MLVSSGIILVNDSYFLGYNLLLKDETIHRLPRKFLF